MRPPIGLPLPMPRTGPMDGPYRFPPQGSVILPNGPPGMARPPMQIALGPRGPMPGGPMVLGRMPGTAPPGVHPSQQVLVMQRPGVPPGTNGPPGMARPQMAPGVPVSSVIPGQHPPGYYPGQPGQGVKSLISCKYFELCVTLAPSTTARRTRSTSSRSVLSWCRRSSRSVGYVAD